MKECLAVIGAQYGSEGKGVIVNHLANRFGVHVRVGGPNAGHSFWHKGQIWKMRAIPCGWTNPDATLIIGRGAVVNPEVLLQELKQVYAVDKTISDRLFVDEGAWCIMAEDVQYEHHIGMVDTIGSTQEGVGVARQLRMQRHPKKDYRFGTVMKKWLGSMLHSDTTHLLHMMKETQNVLLEGTQGAGLSLIHGEWPYVTSADTNASQLAADCGLPPSAITNVLLVMRTFPIRVGGNSGPLREEWSWDELSRIMGRPVREFTTVTGRERRIGSWDEQLIHKAQVLNGAKLAALTFADYMDPGVEGNTVLSDEVEMFCKALERHYAFKVVLVGTGGPHFTVVERGEI